MPSEGYVPCACEACFEIAIGKAGEALCNDCRVAGYTPNAGIVGPEATQQCTKDKTASLE